MSKAALTGDWDKLEKLLAKLGKGGRELEKAIQVAVRQEAQEARTQVIKGFNSGGPPGTSWPPRSPTTIATLEGRGLGKHNKTLIVHADLRNSVTVVARGASAFVGVLRMAQSKSGKPLYNVAKIHEYGLGPFAVIWTPKSRAFLMAMWREAGFEPDPSKAKSRVGETRMVTIPKREFLRPVFVALYGDHEAARKRFVERLTRILTLGTQFGRTGPAAKPRR